MPGGATRTQGCAMRAPPHPRAGVGGVGGVGGGATPLPRHQQRRLCLLYLIQSKYPYRLLARGSLRRLGGTQGREVRSLGGKPEGGEEVGWYA